MPKLKTHQATGKRIIITKRKKFFQRSAGQDHFNARESGNITRNKRRNRRSSITNFKAIKNLIPRYK